MMVVAIFNGSVGRVALRIHVCGVFVSVRVVIVVITLASSRSGSGRQRQRIRLFRDGVVEDTSGLLVQGRCNVECRWELATGHAPFRRVVRIEA